jgi:Cytochrome c7 and related cytochrome c
LTRPYSFQRLMRYLLSLVAAVVLVSAVQAQGIESVMAPGKLMQDHAKYEDNCKQCHAKMDRKAQDGLCMACHKDVGSDVRGKSGFHGRLEHPVVCKTCHSEHKGRDLKSVTFDKKKFDHNKKTDYALHGKHEKVECEKCHVSGKKYRDAAQDCNACHKTDDKHKGSLGAKCADCHNETDWKKAKFDHATTKFSLTGKHTDAKCSDCHKDNTYKDTPKSCYACHRKIDDQKGHKGLYGEKCEACHGTKAWKPSHFNHDEDTKYELRGKHRSTACKECHSGNLYRKEKLGQDCISCHKKDDKHNTNLGSACADCHNEQDWKKTQDRFLHDKTKFPLRNVHAAPAVKCSACHKDLANYRNTSMQCISCHKKDDKHETQLGDECESCHNDKGWTGTSYNHGKSRFPLTGKHIIAACKKCHETWRYKDAPRDCYSCHKKEDKHKQIFGVKCESCHSTRAWTTWSFDHDTRTKYRLEGLHAKVGCEQCHKQVAPVGAESAPLGTACVACHRSNDVHTGNFGPRCEQCHQAEGWKKVKSRAGQGAEK